MLQLLDTLYSFVYDGNLSPYLMAEEKEDYQMALGHQRRAQTELEQRLSREERKWLETLLCNQEETGEERERLSFRRGLVLGIKLGGAGGAVGISPPGAGERRAAQVCRPYREKWSAP